jgi:predicted dehydrogenase
VKSARCAWIVLAAIALSLAVARGAEQQPAPAKKITVAVVGAAHSHTPGFVRTAKGRSDVSVKYVWDHDAARAAGAAAQLNAKVAESLDAIWSDPDVAGVFIYSENDRHHDLVLAAAKAHKHIFVEKPLGITAQECDEAAKAVEDAGVLFNMGYMNRSLPVHIFLKQQIAKGNLGKITHVRGSVCHAGELEGWFDGPYRWLADRKIAGMGAFGDLGTHMLDLLMWMLGDVDAVTADIKVVGNRFGDTDDCGEGLFRFKSGATGTLAASWVDPDNPMTLMIAGTEGYAIIFRGKLYYKSKHVRGADARRAWTDLPPAQPDPVNMFLDAVGGKQSLPLVTAKEAAARVRVMEAMYKAAKERTWVDVK